MSDYIIKTIQSGVLETLQMTFFSALFSYLIGLPLGVLLYATSKGKLLQNKGVNTTVGLLVNLLRSLPFLILLVLLIPFTRFVVGTSIGTKASIVPLTVGAVPIVARMVESSLLEVQPGIIEAATAMGASPFHILVHFIIPEVMPSLLQGAAINVAHRTSVRILPLPERCIVGDGGTSGPYGHDHSGSRKSDREKEEKNVSI